MDASVDASVEAGKAQEGQRCRILCPTGISTGLPWEGVGPGKGRLLSGWVAHWFGQRYKDGKDMDP